MKKTRSIMLGCGLGLSMLAGTAGATCSNEPMLGSICITAANFCPRGYASTEGQLLSIAQNTALFSLLGTTYGGNGQTTFALPDLRGRSAVGMGQGPGLSPVFQGEQGGSENVTLTVNQLPAHSHTAQLRGTTSTGNTDSPANAVPARLPRSNIYSSATGDSNMGTSAVSVGSTGGNQPVSVLDPYLGLRFCIALQGVYPSRD